MDKYQQYIQGTLTALRIEGLISQRKTRLNNISDQTSFPYVSSEYELDLQEWSNKEDEELLKHFA